MAGGLAFGVAFQLRDEFTASAERIRASMAGLGTLTDKVSGSMARSMDQVRLGAGALAAGAAMVAATILPLKEAAKYEQLEVALTTMLGSAEKAVTLMHQMDEFARTTPFEINPVRDSGRMLVAFGKDAESIIPTLRILGNVAAGVGLRLEDLVEVYGRNLAQPHLYMRDIWQITTRGIPILDALAELLNVSKESIPKMVEEGVVSIAHMEQAFKMMGDKGGRFYNLMIKQSGTLTGLWSNMMDGITLSLKAWGMQLLPMAKDIVSVFQRLTVAFQAFAETKVGGFMLKMVSVTGLLLIGLGLVLVSVGGMRYALVMMASAFGVATRATILNTIATAGMTAGIRAMGVALWTALAPVLPALLAVTAALLAMWATWKTVKKALFEFDNMQMAPGGLEGGWIGWLQKLGGVLRGTIELWRSWDSVTQTFNMDEGVYKKLEALGLLNTVMVIGTWIARIKTFFKGVKEGFKEMGQGVVDFFNLFRPKDSQFQSWGDLLGKLTTDLDKVREFGKLAAYGLVILGAVLLLIFAKPLVIIAALAFAVWVLWDAFKWLADIVDKVKLGIMLFSAFIVAFVGHQFDLGKAWVMNLWNGIKSVWSQFMQWLLGKLAAIPGITSILGAGTIAALTAAAYPSRAEASAGPTRHTPAPPVEDTRFLTGQMPAAGKTAIAPNSGSGPVTRNINLILDGQVLSTFIDRHNEDTLSRGN